MSATTRHTSTLGQANEAWALLKIKYPECPTGRHWPEVNIPPPPPPLSPDKIESSPTRTIRPRATAHISQSI